MNLLDHFLEHLALPTLLVVLAGCAWYAWQIKRESPQWPQVTGEITLSRARAMNETGDASGTPTHHWVAEVQYSYEVDGVRYTGSRIRALGLNHFDEAAALSELKPFALGAKVPVFYRPDHPATSVLVPG
ncbi:MAG: hypothetical protein RI907_539 [Pseudomonadota bacterium]|jgi:hypothetical protein